MQQPKPKTAIGAYLSWHPVGRLATTKFSGPWRPVSILVSYKLALMRILKEKVISTPSQVQKGL